MRPVTEKQHSPFGGSSRSRYAACPGSIRISAPFPEREGGPAAIEGTLAHELLECRLTGALWGGGPIDPEMEEAVKVATDYVRSVMARDSEAKCWVEESVQLADDVWGALDVRLVLPRLGEVHIMDFKYGKGVLISAESNKQLRFYAASLLFSDRVPRTCDQFTLTIIQPRMQHEDGPVRSEVLTHAQVVEELALVGREIAAARKPDAPLVTGEHCRWCAGAPACPAQQKLAQEVATLEFKAPAEIEGGLVPTSLGDLLRKLDAVEAWGAKVREYAYQEAEAGRCPDGWKLVAKRATRRWADGALADLPRKLQELGVPPAVTFEPPTVRSIAQLEAAAKKASVVLPEAVHALVTKASSGLKLVTAESPGEPVNRNTPVQDFNVRGTLSDLLG